MGENEYSLGDRCFQPSVYKLGLLLNARNDDSLWALFGKRFSILCCQIKAMMGKSSISQKIVISMEAKVK
jgi:hypothetical protein